MIILYVYYLPEWNNIPTSLLMKLFEIIIITTVEGFEFLIHGHVDWQISHTRKMFILYILEYCTNATDTPASPTVNLSSKTNFIVRLGKLNQLNNLYWICINITTLSYLVAFVSFAAQLAANTFVALNSFYAWKTTTTTRQWDSSGLHLSDKLQLFRFLNLYCRGSIGNIIQIYMLTYFNEKIMILKLY